MVYYKMYHNNILKYHHLTLTYIEMHYIYSYLIHMEWFIIYYTSQLTTDIIFSAISELY